MAVFEDSQRKRARFRFNNFDIEDGPHSDPQITEKDSQIKLKKTET